MKIHYFRKQDEENPVFESREMSVLSIDTVIDDVWESPRVQEYMKYLVASVRHTYIDMQDKTLLF